MCFLVYTNMIENHIVSIENVYSLQHCPYVISVNVETEALIWKHCDLDGINEDITWKHIEEKTHQIKGTN